MMTDREAMKLALEALEFAAAQIYNEDNDDIIANAITVLRQVLEQPEQVNVPEGWKLVPIEPTDAMLSVPVNIDLRECVTPGGVTGLDAVGLFRAWEAMIEAAPQPWNTTDMAYEATTALHQALEQPDQFARLVRIMGTFDLSTGHANNWNDLLNSLESELRDVLGHYREALKMERSTECGGPVAWIHRIIEDGKIAATHVNQVPPEKYNSWWESLPLYTAPPKRKWVGLTDEEIAEGARQSWVDKQAFESAVWWAESKLKEKNT